jgi:amino acid transporter
MARDGIFPFSNYLRWIFEPTKIPLVNVLFVFILDSLLLLLQLVSTTAFSAIIAIATLGFQISYLMPILFRCTTARHTFPLGEFNLGRFSIPNAIISSIWLFITSIFMFFPAEYPVTKDNMNYAIVIIGGVALIASIYWIVSARHWFVGPKRIDIDPTPIPLQRITTEDVMAPSVVESLDIEVRHL